ncbi:hypothetical protein QJS10_CPB20g01734 [Acorus calamus]|uniref:Uncharacterized protein n=1 Tax=Acorus calamus TaxID=4465 RepID=A0AAV9CC43_ACOCL|nr:hypothetical protein QJS10_CPB20g01734 [Acorus calamus]
MWRDPGFDPGSAKRHQVQRKEEEQRVTASDSLTVRCGIKDVALGRLKVWDVFTAGAVVAKFSNANRAGSHVLSFIPGTRDRDLKYDEINIDVYPYREKETIERTGSASVPQIIFGGYERWRGRSSRRRCRGPHCMDSTMMTDRGRNRRGDGGDGEVSKVEVAYSRLSDEDEDLLLRAGDDRDHHPTLGLRSQKVISVRVTASV